MYVAVPVHLTHNSFPTLVLFFQRTFSSLSFSSVNILCDFTSYLLIEIFFLQSPTQELSSSGSRLFF